jgi:NAD(P)H-hydrate epimerase
MVTCAEMKKIERAADEAGLTYYQMMENAGSGAADEIMAGHKIAGKNILILCGKGNNGGDGYVVARKLYGFAGKITLAVLEGPPVSPEAMANYDLCREMDLPMVSHLPAVLDVAASADIIVDALYGTGFHGELKEDIRLLIEGVNRAKAFRVSLDLPSGLGGDNAAGSVGPHIFAHMTVTFHDEKPIHQNPLAHTGQVLTTSIGIEALPPDVLK